MMRIKENYYIKKYYVRFGNNKRAKNKEIAKSIGKRLKVYGTLKEEKRSSKR